MNASVCRNVRNIVISATTINNNKTRKVWNNMVNLRIFSDTDSLPEINKNGNLSNKQWNKIGKFVDFDTS